MFAVSDVILPMQSSLTRFSSPHFPTAATRSVQLVTICLHMEEFITNLAAQMPYIIIIGVILLSGFGAPIPEDIPIILAGYVCGKADPTASAFIMLPALFIAIIGADGIVFWLGRKYGHHVPKLPLLRRYLTEDRLQKTEAQLNKHGGKFIFVARFLPGMRAPAFFTAGIFKLPYWKFLFFDGSAALLSVPAIFFAAYFFADHIAQVKEWVKQGQIGVIIALIIIIAAFIGTKIFIKKSVAKRTAKSTP
ncbi:DedA family protein [Poriferisphaera sp. WC338]|uniref:DedA family protein n=1 Tax=Poriferisphaera sp. WC338 TaxID=3425129 RepID=UPI003D816460